MRLGRLAYVPPLPLLSAALLYAGLSRGYSFSFVPPQGIAVGSAAYAEDLAQFNASVWLPRTEIEIGISLLVVSFLVLALARGWGVPPFLSRSRLWRIGTSRFERLMSKVGSRPRLFLLAGLSAYVFLAFINLTYGLVWVGAGAARRIEHLFHFHFFPGENWLGLAGFLSLLLATLAAASIWSRRGHPRPFLRAVELVAAPATLAWEVTLLFAVPGSMVVHAVNFLLMSLGGVDLVSNWMVLVVSSFFTALGAFEVAQEKTRAQRPSAAPLR